MQTYFKYLSHIALDILFPRICVRCTATGSYLCDICQAQIPRNNAQRCIVCQKPSVNGWTHPHCKTPFTPDRLITIFDYRSFPIAKLITHGKYHFIAEIFYVLGTIAATEVCIPNYAVLCPIPLAKRKQKWRGFNQTDIIASAIGSILNIDVHAILFRTQYTMAQKDLNKSQRQKNIAGAYSLLQPPTVSPIILIDDVTTTGSTFKEASATIKQHVDSEVWCLAIAQD